jgi:hypothetical protein
MVTGTEASVSETSSTASSPLSTTQTATEQSTVSG